MSEATASERTSALAPGYAVETTTVGGVMLGNCSIGKPQRAMPPAIIVMIAITLAKIGRSMKNRENMSWWWPERRNSGTIHCGGEVLALGLGENRVDLQVGAGAQQALDDDAVLGPDLARDHTQVIDPPTGLDRARLDDIVAPDDQKKRAGLVGPERTLGYEQRVVGLPGRDTDPHEESRQDRAFGIGKDSAQLDGARSGVGGRVLVIGLSHVRIAALVGETQFHGHRGLARSRPAR